MKPRTAERRAEIQALRAIAVAIVVLYHLWPKLLPGGFVGVDVFFAISGFLITAHLLREVSAGGTVSLWGFWARRARRLLPAALLTLLACALATIAFVPQSHWQQFLTEIGASTAYVQNWQLASNAVDYLAADNQPSPVQHFWSLSAEEQFYVVWPLLIALAAAVAPVRRPRARHTAIAVALGAVTLASLAYSISETASNPEAAYFVTPARAWEFGAGGLLAVLGGAARPRGALAAALSWAGLSAVLAAALLFDGATPFPGATALLPVLGALAIIHAGMPLPRWAPSRLLALAPVQFLGNISYSVYLWHWPLIVLAPFVAVAAGLATNVAILAITLVVAWLTKVLVEDPVRRSTVLGAGPPRLTFACTGAATAVVVAVLAGGSSYVHAEIRRAERVTDQIVASKPGCFGAAARDPHRPCENRRLRLAVVPAPIEAKRRENAKCARFVRDGVVSTCVFGARASVATRTVALLGDSHASHWRAALEVVARERGWRGLSVTRTSCPFSTATRVIPEPERSRCATWRGALPRWFRKHPEIDTVFVAAVVGGVVNVPPGRTMFEAKVNGFRNAWRSLPRTVKHVVVIRDTPKVSSNTLACIERAVADRERPGLACALPRRAALAADPQVAAARASGSRRVQVVDLTPYLCSDRLCFPVVGGALVHKDLHHLTRVLASTLGAPLGRELEPLMRSWTASSASAGGVAAAADGGGDHRGHVAVAGDVGVDEVR